VFPADGEKGCGMAWLGIRVSGVAAVMAWIVPGPALVHAEPVHAEGGLAPHRAVYDIVLDPSAANTDVADLSGRMVMEFTGSECAGYKVTLRFVTEIEDSEGEHRVTDSRTTSFEHPGGRSFEFNNQTYIDQNLTEESRGSAERTTKGIEVSLLKPGTKRLGLGRSVVFPTQQIEEIVAAAKAGQSFVEADVYDGSEDGETVYSTAAVIGRGAVGPPADADAAAEEGSVASAGIGGVRYWPVTVSYFQKGEKGEQTPTYVMAYRLYENGISRSLRIDYGGFAVTGRLASLQLLPEEPCK
jgi:hypothetical protein